MKTELKLFTDNIKPAILITKYIYEKHEHILNKYNVKEYNNGTILVYKEESAIENKSIGEILGYPPMCAKEFEDREKEQRGDKFVSKFINYGGIQFNCFDKYQEAIEWCNQEYKKKMLDKYGCFKVSYAEIEFTKNYVKGYDREIKHQKLVTISK